MIALVGTLNPENEMFQKGFRPPSSRQANQPIQQMMIPNKGGFFDNLEPLSVKEMKRKGSINFLTKKEKLQFELERIKEREERLQIAKRKKEADLALADDEQDNFKVKISMEDWEILKKAKQQLQGNPMVFGGLQ